LLGLRTVERQLRRNNIDLWGISMKGTLKFLITILIIALIGMCLIYIYSGKENIADKNVEESNASGEVAGVSTENPVSENSADTTSNVPYVEKLAQHLSSNGVILYGAYWDQKTEEQKKLFGDSARLVDYVECDQAGTDPNPDECVAQNITVYPTWVYQEKQYQNIQSLAELAKISGFTKDSGTD